MRWGVRRDKTALIWEGEPGEIRRLTYAELHVVKCRNSPTLLKDLGIKKGDRVAVYMGMTPEAWRLPFWLALASGRCTR